SLQIIIAFCFFVYAWVKRPEVLRVDRETVLWFGGLLTVINFLKAIFLFTVLRWLVPESFEATIRIFDMIPANHLLAVWWEDSFYVLPYLLVAPAVLALKGWKKAAALIAFALLFLATTVHFTLGHLYQGPAGLVTFVYPIISYYVAGRKGLGTMIALHILFDFTIYMSVWLLMVLAGV